ncbi:MAG: IS1 family transposase [Sedimentisphaerales bacterium]
MNKLNKEKQVQVIASLVEGNSIRATVRMTGVAKNTVTNLLIDVGRACEKYHNEIMVNLPCKRIQVDEIWSFCYAKQKNVPEELKGKFGYGDVWTWIAIDPDTKLVPSWMVGGKGSYWAKRFMADLAARMANRIQLTTDAYTAYYEAVWKAFNDDVDYAQLMKSFGPDWNLEGKYSPNTLLAAIPRPMIGCPERKHISTSHIERQNLTVRMQLRRFTRLTNGFSKKIENLNWAVALHFLHYNFCRIHQTLRMTPAMKAGITDHLWEIEDIIKLLS